MFSLVLAKRNFSLTIALKAFFWFAESNYNDSSYRFLSLVSSEGGGFNFAANTIFW